MLCDLIRVTKRHVRKAFSSAVPLDDYDDVDEQNKQYKQEREEIRQKLNEIVHLTKALHGMQKK